MPIAIATCWLSATARIAMPLRDFRKNQTKPARNARLTPAPSNWIGGMKSGPSMNGSSRMGSGSGLDPEKIVNGPRPRRIDASPMVAITTAITGRPMSLRSITRSRMKPKATRLTSASAMASHNGAPRHETGDHHELALGEVDGVGRLVDQHEAQRDQRVHQADQEAVGHQKEEEAQVVRHGPWSPPRRPRPARATSWWPCGRPRR